MDTSRALSPDEEVQVAPTEVIKRLSFRAAKARFHIGYETWRAIRSGELDNWEPHAGGRPVDASKVSTILDSVSSAPHWSTVERARRLGIRTETVQSVLARRGLSRLTARLSHAGYAVDVVRPLAVARKRRIVAAAPGVYTCIDFKTLGVVGRLGKSKAVTVGGCVVVDQLTGFGTVLLCERADAQAACAGVEKHRQGAPFPVRGLVLSDNGQAFLSDAFTGYLAQLGFVQRTTRFNHPWSNGKVEALNRTLKYQCMPPLVSGAVNDLAHLQALVDAWMQWYNEKRSHTGWINRGLPPTALWELWQKAEGGDVERLLALGILKPEDAGKVRVMGANKLGMPLSDVRLAEDGRPFAFVLEDAEDYEPTAAPPALPEGGFRVAK